MPNFPLRKHTIAFMILSGICTTLIIYFAIIVPERLFAIPKVGPDLLLKYYQTIGGIIGGLMTGNIPLALSMVREYLERKNVLLSQGQSAQEIQNQNEKG